MLPFLPIVHCANERNENGRAAGAVMWSRCGVVFLNQEKLKTERSHTMNGANDSEFSSTHFSLVVASSLFAHSMNIWKIRTGGRKEEVYAMGGIEEAMSEKWKRIVDDDFFEIHSILCNHPSAYGSMTIHSMLEYRARSGTGAAMMNVA